MTNPKIQRVPMPDGSIALTAPGDVVENLARTWLVDPTGDPEIVEPIVRAYLALVGRVTVTTGTTGSAIFHLTMPPAYAEGEPAPRCEVAPTTAPALGSIIANERGYVWRFALTAADVLDIIAAMSHQAADMRAQMREHGVDWQPEIDDLERLIGVFSSQPGERP